MCKQCVQYITLLACDILCILYVLEAKNITTIPPWTDWLHRHDVKYCIPEMESSRPRPWPRGSSRPAIGDLGLGLEAVVLGLGAKSLALASQI